jgi:hypothetical protein
MAFLPTQTPSHLHDSLIEQPAVAAACRHPITQIVGLLRNRRLDGIRVQPRRVQRVEDRYQPSGDRVECRGDRLTSIAAGQAGDEIRLHGLALPRVPVAGGNIVTAAQEVAGLLQVNGVVTARHIGRKAPVDQTERGGSLRFLSRGGCQADPRQKERETQGKQEQRPALGPRKINLGHANIHFT